MVLLTSCFLKDVSNDVWKGMCLFCCVLDADRLETCERRYASKVCKLYAGLQFQSWTAAVLSLSLWTDSKENVKT